MCTRNERDLPYEKDCDRTNDRLDFVCNYKSSSDFIERGKRERERTIISFYVLIEKRNAYRT